MARKPRPVAAGEGAWEILPISALPVAATLPEYSTPSIVEKDPDEEKRPVGDQRGKLSIVLFLGLAPFRWGLRRAEDVGREEGSGTYPLAPLLFLGMLEPGGLVDKVAAPWAITPASLAQIAATFAAAFCARASVRRMIFALFLAWALSLQAATAAFLSSTSLALFPFAAFFLALSMVLVVAMRETLPVQMGARGGKDGERPSLDLGNKIIHLLFVCDEVCGPPNAREDITRGSGGGGGCNVANSWHNEREYAGRFSSYMFPWSKVVGGSSCVWCCAVPAPKTKNYHLQLRQK
jgi:hypothetical protein